jgi:ParB-like chromosome segregation protein Spo0J
MLYRNPVILAQAWQKALDSGKHLSLADLGRKLAISRARVAQVLRLLRLAPEGLNAIAALGDPLPRRIISKRRLRSIVDRSATDQRQEISRILAKRGQTAPPSA